MGAYKQKMLEKMEDEDHTDEYGAFMDNDSFDEDCEERAIEKSIEDELQTLNEIKSKNLCSNIIEVKDQFFRMEDD